ncbi:mitochondrial protein C2orf69 homolog isoform X2 [Calliopsis andreniformis]|uniref:mitochondrial protein C2orf69 homolog isoform X2 n=1 Tax=Calliopsis andreniformis TaxID=337506 RepID=UPI003FCC2862
MQKCTFLTCKVIFSNVMSSKIWVWKKVPGITGRCNDIIYSRPTLLPSQDILVYFGGDVQDTQENMEQHMDSKKYIEWSLQNTGHILSTNFPKKHILIIRPSSCFDNFVPANEYGVPSFLPTHNALKHLRELIKSSLEHIKTCNVYEDHTHFNTEKTRLSFMGFSKGCVVLNQLLHEFHYYQNKPNIDVEINNFIKLIESMWWLDGGHAGPKDIWITEKSILESFAKLRINVHVHVTPYQIEDVSRPWIHEEENEFCSTLRDMGVSIKRVLHFADKPRSLKLHFNILKAIGNYTQ